MMITNSLFELYLSPVLLLLPTVYLKYIYPYCSDDYLAITANRDPIELSQS